MAARSSSSRGLSGSSAGASRAPFPNPSPPFTLANGTPRIPFYAYIRLAFLLYLVLPQTQGARILYQTRVHPYLEANESRIEDLIATAHERLRTTGLSSLRYAIHYVKSMLLGQPIEEQPPAPPPRRGSGPGYAQGLLARFAIPAARLGGAGATGADFYNFLSSAVAAAVSTGTPQG
ncbi:HVA22/TB2/DP1 family protein, partial [Candidatus Bathyarchaeota archaeon]|nr:HVA22/TB2/DP1 family protein [Candidatus Bathyarchaeota archaeon]